MEIFFNTFQVESNDAKNFLVLAATNTPYAMDMVRKKNTIHLITYGHVLTRFYDLHCFRFEGNAKLINIGHEEAF